MARTRIPEKTIRRLYGLLSPPMIDIDCGRLCAPANDGVPLCCDPELAVPLLLRDEFLFQRQSARFWKRLPRRTPEQRALARRFDSYNDFACRCPGVEKCERSRRALVCRLFPFEPQVDGRGRILGLTFTHDGPERCPLIAIPNLHPNPAYVRGAIAYWEEIFTLLPEERELFVSLSANRRRRFRRRGREIPLFVAEEPAG